MTESIYHFWLDAKGKGLFECPSFDADFQLPKNYRDNPGLVCAYALDRAKRADFSLMPAVLDLYGRTGRPIFESMVLVSVAHAGPATCFSRIVDMVTRTPDLGKVQYLCGAMAERGELSYVPIFLDKYLSNERNPNASSMIRFIGDLIGDAVDSLDLEDCEEQVLDCYRQMVDRFGTEKALVFRGERYSVGRLAQHILDRVKKPYFLSSLRRSFEGATGIDCTSWYQDGALCPLAATAIVEDFLESPEAEKYEEGVRYFFGHRIPD